MASTGIEPRTRFVESTCWLDMSDYFRQNSYLWNAMLMVLWLASLVRDWEVKDSILATSIFYVLVWQAKKKDLTKGKIALVALPGAISRLNKHSLGAGNILIIEAWTCCFWAHWPFLTSLFECSLMSSGRHERSPNIKRPIEKGLNLKLVQTAHHRSRAHCRHRVLSPKLRIEL